MEKQRRWQFLLILTVAALTVYNILPTAFYYLKPLKEPIGPVAAEKIAAAIESRTIDLETEARDWLDSYCNLIHTKPASISIDPENPQIATVTFSKIDDARRLRAVLPRAGSLIPFAPAQLTLASQDDTDKEVLIQRKIPLRLQKNDFSYAPKNDKKIIDDRMEQIALALAGPSDSSAHLNYLNQGHSLFPVIETLAAEINAISEIFGDTESGIAARLAARFTHGSIPNKAAAVHALVDSFNRASEAIAQEKSRISENEDQAQNVEILEKKAIAIASAKKYLKKHSALFEKGSIVVASSSQILQALSTSRTLDFSGVHPLFSHLTLDTQKEQIVLKFHPDIASVRSSSNIRFEQLIINEIARISRLSNEELTPSENEITIPLHILANVSGYLILDQKKVAARMTTQIHNFLKSQWSPRHPDLQNLPIVDYDTFIALPQEQKALCLVVASPLISGEGSLPGLNAHSIYVSAKGIEKIVKTYEQFPESQQATDFNADLRSLAEILYSNGFLGMPGSAVFGTLAGNGDFIFEKPNFSNALLAATREDFLVRGTKKMAVIELSDVEQRIITDNRIETLIHEDLLKWKDEYKTAQVNIDPRVHFDIPKPTKSVFWSNIALSARKYLRGDDRKIIKWGLDLSGGKTVQIELRDSKRQVVKEDADLKQGINEIYNRVNKMGVSEVSIRQIGHHIVVDFPGSQALSAQDLIKASTMYFHVVNEKFSHSNPSLAESAGRFLEEVWNEACVIGHKDPQSVNDIALRHLHPENESLRTNAAQMLWENGLRLASRDDPNAGRTVEDSVSKIAIFRGSEPTEWHGQSHPLLIVFRNWAMEGADLTNIHAGYDPSKGNFLSFDISATQGAGTGKIHPRNDLSAWTSRYSKEKVQGTPLENSSKGRGWRMAVLLNDSIISAPTLDSPLRDSAMISGSFSQSEVNRLASDLKAGSLTFSPQILSEKNVSPELGKADRLKGITATVAALMLVIGSMVVYYRFAGLIASIAVIFNLLILWATLQNLGATLTLAGLAGVILTVGMAVDANVLVFERIKEEFAESGSIRSAIAAGYKKAYSAIIDSNVTTIIAALILLNFDAGPIKSFAVNLIIGIVSSMFTALFMTRFYFTGWAQNPKNKALKMANWIRSTRFDFLKRAKTAFAMAAAIIVIGSFSIYSERSSIFGMDFTGGYALNLELNGKTEGSYVAAVESALLKAGADSSDFQIRELNPSNNLRVLFGTTLEQVGKPFYQMPVQTEQNPRIAWIVAALESEGIALAPHSQEALESNWTAMSGQMSDSMRNNALIGLAISFACIFTYLAFRFEYKFAAAALICLFHDVLITLGLVGLLHAFGLGIQIDLNTIAALMTIIGYSLNDTIIIFDRIREEMLNSRGKKLTEIVNHALNATLSRTTITSGTTLLVLIALVILGGPSIFGFALVMAIGVFFGTLSSWFIAAPLMIFFHKREEVSEKPVHAQ